MEQQQELQLVQIPQHIKGFCLPFIEKLLSFIKESDEYREALTTDKDHFKYNTYTPGFKESCIILSEHLQLGEGYSYPETLLKFVEGIETICSLFTTETEQSSSFMGVNFREVKKLIDFVKSCEEYNQKMNDGMVVIKTGGLHLALTQLNLHFPHFCHVNYLNNRKIFHHESFEFFVSEFETIEKLYKQ